MTGPAGGAVATVAAVDLGASAGRVMAGRVGPGGLELREAHRFPNLPVSAGGTLHWDILGLYREILDGLRSAADGCELASAGIDSWGVDYGLIDSGGALLGNPVHYRDRRTEGAVERVLARIPARELYAVTGIQQLPFNTICQLAAAEDTPQLRAAATLLLIPDLLGYWLTGSAGAEITNASTTQLLDVRERTWAVPVIDRAGIPPGIFPPLRRPGEVVGELLPEVAVGAGLPAGLPVVAVGSHDTASAVAGVPAQGENFAYISCGTWSLVGMELDRPVLTEASRAANFSNETGVDGTVRYLRNVAGLWLLQESLRTWAADGAGRPGRPAGRCRAAAGAALGDRRRRPRAGGSRRHACPDRRGLRSTRAGPAGQPGGDRPVHPGQPGARAPARPAARRPGLSRGGTPTPSPRRRRRQERAAVPAHRRRLRAARGGRARSRRRRSATSWFRRARWDPRRPTWTGFGPWSGPSRPLRRSRARLAGPLEGGRQDSYLGPPAACPVRRCPVGGSSKK